MNNSDLVRSIARELSLPIPLADAYVDTFFNVVGSALRQKRRIELRGFGTLIPRARKPRQGVDPRTQTPIAIPAKITVNWRTAAELRERVDSSPL